ncbi:hypothetical protein J7I97_21120 [Streptomyces sp. ISL-87]|nr:hypothetical protein [Streptomyces sp. ISL-21]MBT2610699.1 hypothetical protein [Streptomyces sp. ISL-87]
MHGGGRLGRGAEHVPDEGATAHAQTAQGRAVVDGDEPGRGREENPPDRDRRPAGRPRQTRQSLPEAQAVERHVTFLVRQDPPRDLRRQRIRAAVPHRPVIPQGHHLGHHQHQQLHP